MSQVGKVSNMTSIVTITEKPNKQASLFHTHTHTHTHSRERSDRHFDGRLIVVEEPEDGSSEQYSGRIKPLIKHQRHNQRLPLATTKHGRDQHEQVLQQFGWTRNKQGFILSFLVNSHFIQRKMRGFLFSAPRCWSSIYVMSIHGSV